MLNLYRLKSDTFTNRQNNYDGYACHHCKPGWTGSDCRTRRPSRVRRNALALSPEEQRRVRDRINLAKRTPMTEWLVLNITDRTNGDPIDVIKIQLIQPPSVYDYYVYIHLYASRSTLVMQDSSAPVCDPNRHRLDFAHKVSVAEVKFIIFISFRIYIFLYTPSQVFMKQFAM